MQFKITKLIPVAALVCVGLASCKKNDAVSKPSSQPSSQLMRTTNLIDLGQGEVATDVSDIVGGQTDDPTVCRHVSYSPSYNTYPHLKTIDYGTGCTDSLGKTISGKKLVTEYADWTTAPAGTKISVASFSNYYINGLSIQGSSVVYLNAAASSGHPVFKTVLTKTITDDQGNSSTYVGTILSKQISGYFSEAKGDDNFEMTGTTWGTEINGGTTLATWKAIIDNNNPVIKNGACSYRGKGGVNITISTNGNGVTDTEYLDYGNGDCDASASLSVNGGSPTTVTLPLVFYTAHL